MRVSAIRFRARALADFLLHLPVMTKIELAERLRATEASYRRVQRGNDADAYRRALRELLEAQEMAVQMLSETTSEAGP